MTTTGDVTPEMVLQMRQEIADLQGNVYAVQQFVSANNPAALKSQIEEMFDMKINTAMAMAAAPQLDREKSYHKPILESNAIKEVPALTNAKGHRSWNRKMKNAMEQVREKSRTTLELLEKLTEEQIQTKYIAGGCTTKKEAIIQVMEEKHGQHYKDLEEPLEIANRDMWSILSAKSSGEAEEKMEGCAQGEGLYAYFRIHSWFTRTTA